jgi:hypothetical protein
MMMQKLMAGCSPVYKLQSRAAGATRVMAGSYAHASGNAKDFATEKVSKSASIERCWHDDELGRVAITTIKQLSCEANEHIRVEGTNVRLVQHHNAISAGGRSACESLWHWQWT